MEKFDGALMSGHNFHFEFSPEKKKSVDGGDSFSTYGISGMSTSTKNVNPQPEKKFLFQIKKMMYYLQ